MYSLSYLSLIPSQPHLLPNGVDYIRENMDGKMESVSVYSYTVGLSSKLVHYVGNLVPFSMQTKHYIHNRRLWNQLSRIFYFCSYSLCSVFFSVDIH